MIKFLYFALVPLTYAAQAQVTKPITTPAQQSASAPVPTKAPKPAPAPTGPTYQPIDPHLTPQQQQALAQAQQGLADANKNVLLVILEVAADNDLGKVQVDPKTGQWYHLVKPDGKPAPATPPPAK